MNSQTPTTAAAECVDLAGDFGFSLLVLAHTYRTVVASALEDVPQGARGYQTLAAVVQGDQPNQLALATYLRIDRTVMTYLIDDLVAAGLVERLIDPADRRQRKIVATAQGINTLRDLQRQVREAEDRLLDALDEGERQTFRSMLGRIAHGVRDVESTGEPCDIADPGC
ncbi:MarR family winged helix-turn-helix transcriptional regulator [Streptomyces sp. NBC_01351]|uniref:MarR family winged helix-turn-helix transcriptional regulator n=1 Tax=Streptomyces sp. NBC_01351 TaxID=2903833 RepID=UPI002E36D234|nr:MarR family winged helix-turn-helix transcriptional regulator [Streptomyces sp. NBC_01351]